MRILVRGLAMPASLICLFCLVLSPQAAAQYEIQDAFPSLRFTQPVDFAADGLGALYVAEREGRIYAFENDSTTTEKKLFLDLSDKVLTDPIESGLLGLAFHPGYEENGFFFVYYVADSPLRSVVARFTRSEDDPFAADASSEHVILEVDQPTGRHNGGDISFDGDGFMLVSLGDGSAGKDQFDNAQNLSTLLGSIIRIDVDNPAGGQNYGIPPDNPFVGNIQGHREEIYAYGFRNPWRFSIDPKTNNIWVGDVGEVTWEKIAIATKGGNSGWPIVEGPDCYRPPENCVRDDLIPPVHYYHHDVGISVTGGYVYRGHGVPELTGKYIFADWASFLVYAISHTGTSPLEAGSVVEVEQILDSKRRISSFGVDESNELYMLSTFNGEIFRFKATVSLNSESPELPSTPALTLALDGPNPVMAETGFTIETDATTHVNVTVFDVLGREVKVLHDSHVVGRTPRSLKLDGSALPAGIYIVRAQSAHAVSTKSVVVVR